jgi:hypothetical protein
MPWIKFMLFYTIFYFNTDNKLYSLYNIIWGLYNIVWSPPGRSTLRSSRGKGLSRCGAPFNNLRVPKTFIKEGRFAPFSTNLIYNIYKHTITILNNVFKIDTLNYKSRLTRLNISKIKETK